MGAVGGIIAAVVILVGLLIVILLIRYALDRHMTGGRAGGRAGGQADTQADRLILSLNGAIECQTVKDIAGTTESQSYFSKIQTHAGIRLMNGTVNIPGEKTVYSGFHTDILMLENVPSKLGRDVLYNLQL